VFTFTRQQQRYIIIIRQYGLQCLTYLLFGFLYNIHISLPQRER
jgi:hypothetical protein